MESPAAVTNFLYLLMRDHLPTGRVRELIERSASVGEVCRSSAELEELASRYGADLLAELEVSPPPAESPPAEPGNAYGQVLADPRTRELADDSSGWLSVRNLVDATGLAVQTIRNKLQRAIREGKAEAKGQTKTRRYRSIEQTSEPGHDDDGKGAKPADPSGETEEGDHDDDGQSEALPAQTDREHRGSSDDGGQPGASAAAAVGQHARPKETDIELMARVGDYIKDSEAEVYPTEIDSVFALEVKRRQRIISMLLERHRIVKVGGGPRTAYISREKDTTDFSINGGDDDETMGRPLHLKKPEKGKHSRAPKLTEDLIRRFKKWALGQRTFKRRHVVDAFPDLSTSTIARLCARMAADGFLENRGSGGGSHYAVKESAAPADSLGRRIESADEGTLEGQVMAILEDDGTTFANVLSRTGAERDEVGRVIAKLIHEGNVRIGRSNGSLHYVTT